MPFIKIKKHTEDKQETESRVFITIDDLQKLAEELHQGLIQLGEYKYPLKVRKGNWKEVTHLSDQDERSRIIKAGKKTYFFDIKESKDGKPYLLITESWFKSDSENGEPERNTIIVFPEQANEFAMTVSVMLAKII